MAKRKPNGHFSGITGGVVICDMGDKEVMRIRSRKRKDTSALVGECRTDFAVVMKYVRKMKKVIDTGFRDYKPNRSAYHSALSVNLNNYRSAAPEVKPGLTWFRLSAGKLSNAASISANIMPEGTLEITWQGTEPGQRFYKTDTAIAVVYLPAADKFLTAPHGTPRTTGRLTIPMFSLPEGETATVFVFFTVAGENYRKESEGNVSETRVFVLGSEI